MRDARPLTGDSASSARVVAALPFSDAGDTSLFGDAYACQAQVGEREWLLDCLGDPCLSLSHPQLICNRSPSHPIHKHTQTRANTKTQKHKKQDAAPDVVYRLTPPRDVQVAASTCGSAFDTKLILARDAADAATYVCNDDDRGCGHSASNSRIDAALKVGRPVWPPLGLPLQTFCGRRLSTCRHHHNLFNNAPLHTHTHTHKRAQAGVTYYLIVDGYGRSSGEYTLSITCSDCGGGGGALQMITDGGGGGGGSGGDGSSGDAGGGSGGGGARRLAERATCGGGAGGDGTRWNETAAAADGGWRGGGGDSNTADATDTSTASDNSTGWGEGPRSRGRAAAEPPVSAPQQPAATTQGAQHGVATPLVFEADLAPPRPAADAGDASV